MGVVAFLCLNIQTIQATSLQYRSNNFVSGTDSATWLSIVSVLTTLGINAGGYFNSVLLVR